MPADYPVPVISKALDEYDMFHPIKGEDRPQVCICDMDPMKLWNGLVAYHKSDERIEKMEHEAHLSAIGHGYADK